MERVVAVVAIGEAADEVTAVFGSHRRVVRATSMADAVALAADLAAPGDVVLLSPGCASFDWYPDGGYPARGADFRRHVEAVIGSPPHSPSHQPEEHR
jgi:UDP-N-acetylmuramoylalanine--D-glutamate ligase